MKLTLTNVSNFVRKYGPMFVLFVLAFFIIYYSVKIGIIIYKAQKGPEIFYNPIFGVIKRPLINDSTNSAGLNFSIDTIEGKPVTTTASANIYFAPLPETKFGYRNTLFMMAENFGIFNPSSKYKLTEKHAEFNEDFQKLEIDITNFNFLYKYNYEKDTTIFDNLITPTGEEAKTEAIRFLQSIDKYPEEFKNSKVQIKYFFFDKEKNTLIEVKRNLDANIVEISFTRPDLDKKTFVSKTYPLSHNYIKMIPTYNGYKVIDAQIRYFERSNEHYGVYPVKTADEAFKILKKGKGILLQKNLIDKKIIIKKIFIGYFDFDQYEEYFQPVYVFEGENGFAAFVPALTEDYLSE